MESVVSFLIRHQSAIFALMSILVIGERIVPDLMEMIRALIWKRGRWQGAEQGHPRQVVFDFYFYHWSLLPTVFAFFFAVVFLLFSLTKPLSPTLALALPLPLCSKSEATKLLLFIHGWNGDGTGTWKK